MKKLLTGNSCKMTHVKNNGPRREEKSSLISVSGLGISFTKSNSICVERPTTSCRKAFDTCMHMASRCQNCIMVFILIIFYQSYFGGPTMCTKFIERGTRIIPSGPPPVSFLYVELYHTVTLQLLIFEFRKSQPVEMSNKKSSLAQTIDLVNAVKLYLNRPTC